MKTAKQWAYAVLSSPLLSSPLLCSSREHFQSDLLAVTQKYQDLLTELVDWRTVLSNKSEGSYQVSWPYTIVGVVIPPINHQLLCCLYAYRQWNEWYSTSIISTTAHSTAILCVLWSNTILQHNGPFFSITNYDVIHVKVGINWNTLRLWGRLASTL